MFRRKYYEVWYDITDFRGITTEDRCTQWELNKKEAKAFAKARAEEDEFSNIRLVRVRKRVLKHYK